MLAAPLLMAPELRAQARRSPEHAVGAPPAQPGDPARRRSSGQVDSHEVGAEKPVPGIWAGDQGARA